MFIEVRIFVFLALCILSAVVLTDLNDDNGYVYAASAKVADSYPMLVDPNLNVDLYFKGLRAPTSMVFIDKDDILVTQKNDGTVARIVNGTNL